jgi:hypothetical protein
MVAPRVALGAAHRSTRALPLPVGCQCETMRSVCEAHQAPSSGAQAADERAHAVRFLLVSS